jgi:hypothetical protein
MKTEFTFLQWLHWTTELSNQHRNWYNRFKKPISVETLVDDVKSSWMMIINNVENKNINTRHSWTIELFSIDNLEIKRFKPMTSKEVQDILLHTNPVITE